MCICEPYRWILAFVLIIPVGYFIQSALCLIKLANSTLFHLKSGLRLIGERLCFKYRALIIFKLLGIFFPNYYRSRRRTLFLSHLLVLSMFLLNEWWVCVRASHGSPPSLARFILIFFIDFGDPHYAYITGVSGAICTDHRWWCIRLSSS